MDLLNKMREMRAMSLLDLATEVETECRIMRNRRLGYGDESFDYDARMLILNEAMRTLHDKMNDEPF